MLVRSDKMSSYRVEMVIRGYHMYKEVWDAVGQVLPCQQERGYVRESYAVAVVERGVIV